MNARTRFWLMFGGCVVIALVAWSLSVPRLTSRVDDLGRELERKAERMHETAETAAGPAMFDGLQRAHDQARSDLKALHDRFAAADEQTFDVWFADLDMSWKNRPDPAEFERSYLLAVDALIRDSAAALAEAGVKNGRVQVHRYEWMSQDDHPEVNAMRSIQREFNVEERIVLALARRGAATSSAVESLGVDAAAGVGSERLFERSRYRVKVMVDPDRLIAALHTFDSAIDPQGRPVTEGSGGLHVAVHQVAVSRVDVDTSALAELTDEPPVELEFDLQVLDYKGRGNDH